MFRRILIPVDFAAKNSRAVEASAELAASVPEREVFLLHVIETIDAGAPGAFRRFYARLEARARRKMAPLAARLARRGLEVRAEILYGNRVATILRFVRDRRIDLIVMSSHPLRLEHPVRGWDTISYRVAILSSCPTLLVKAPAGTLKERSARSRRQPPGRRTKRASRPVRG